MFENLDQHADQVGGGRRRNPHGLLAAQGFGVEAGGDRDGAWKDANTYTQSLLGRRVGIHGFGSISQCLVPMLRPFTSQIQAFSPSMPDGIAGAKSVR